MMSVVWLSVGRSRKWSIWFIVYWWINMCKIWMLNVSGTSQCLKIVMKNLNSVPTLLWTNVGDGLCIVNLMGPWTGVPPVEDPGLSLCVFCVYIPYCGPRMETVYAWWTWWGPVRGFPLLRTPDFLSACSVYTYPTVDHGWRRSMHGEPDGALYRGSPCRGPRTFSLCVLSAGIPSGGDRGTKSIR